MKTTHKLILALFAMAVLTVWTTGVYAEQDPWQGDESPRSRSRGVELTEEKIDEIMAQLAETNPEQAEHLEKLREENPVIFKMQLKRIARGETANRRSRRNYAPGQGRGRPGGMDDGMPGRPQTRGMRGKTGRGMEMARQKETELLEWLEKNDPDRAEEFSKLKKENPRLYLRKMSSAIRMYREIIEIEKTNPALAAVIKEDLGLKTQVGKLMRKFRTATDDEKETLRDELESLTSKRFDLIIKKKQLQYEDLKKKLEELKNNIKESEAELETLKSKKSDHIKERLDELIISKSEKINWD